MQGLQPGAVDFRVLTMTSQLRASRRLIAAGNAERERMGRDLHDGAQQTLTALRIRLSMAAEQFHERGDDEASDVLRELGGRAEEAIDELRRFAHGVYPDLLVSEGLSAALAAAVRRTPGAASLDAHGIGRYPCEIEVAVYFCCMAAMDNAAKHAGSAAVTISVSETAVALRFSVQDTGQGFDPKRTPPGAGITNMRDRIASVGGTLTIDSAPSQGTRVAGAVVTPPRVI